MKRRSRSSKSGRTRKLMLFGSSAIRNASMLLVSTGSDARSRGSTKTLVRASSIHCLRS